MVLRDLWEVKKLSILTMVTFLFATSSVWARFQNAGLYMNAKSAKYGESFVLKSVILSSQKASGVVITIGLHRINNGSISAGPAFSKAFTNQSFVANEKKVYDVPYTVPDSIVSGKYAMVIKVGNSAGSSEHLLAQGTVSPYLVELEGKPQSVPTPAPSNVLFQNAGVYIGITNVSAGSSIVINNSFRSSANLSNVKVRFEIRKVSSSGEISSTPLVVKELPNESFMANTNKGYKQSYAIPSNATSGKYIISAFVKDSSGRSLLDYNTVSNINGFTVNGSASSPAPAPAPLPTPTPPDTTKLTIRVRSSLVENEGALVDVYVNGEVIDRVQVNNTEYKDYSFSLNESESDIDSIYLHFLNDKYLDGKDRNLYIQKISLNDKSYVATDSRARLDQGSLGGTLIPGQETLAWTGYFILNLGSTSIPAPAPAPAPVPAPVDVTYLRGINIMDLGTAYGNVPGTFEQHYTRPSLKSLEALKSRGIKVVRLPFIWERIQHSLGGSLDPFYRDLLTNVLIDCDKAGLKAIIDMHNYTKYTDKGVKKVFGASNAPTHAQFADVWKKISTHLRSVPQAYNAVYAYDLMNEPSGIPSNTGKTSARIWEEYAQAAVSGIRSVGDKKLIHVEGDTYSAAHRWRSNHPKPFINDPANNIMYHAHMYIDNDSSGQYKNSYDQEEAFARSQGHASVGARGVARLKKFADWCAEFKQRCFLGEFGWPATYYVGSRAEALKWNAAGEELMEFMDSVRMGGTLWATGSWFGESGNILNSYILPRGTRQFKPLSQAEVLERHLGED